MTLAFISGISYSALFLIMVFEGPVATSAASFAARFGFFSLWAIFALSILGDLVGDALYYAIGYFSRTQLVDRHGHRFGLTPERLAKFDEAFKQRGMKTLVLAKLSPALPGPVIIAAGALRLPFWTLIWVSLALAVPKYLLFMALGYLFGNLYVTFFHYYDIVGWLFVGGGLVACYFIYKTILKKILR